MRIDNTTVTPGAVPKPAAPADTRTYQSDIDYEKSGLAPGTTLVEASEEAMQRGDLAYIVFIEGSKTDLKLKADQELANTIKLKGYREPDWEDRRNQYANYHRKMGHDFLELGGVLQSYIDQAVKTGQEGNAGRYQQIAFKDGTSRYIERALEFFGGYYNNYDKSLKNRYDLNHVSEETVAAVTKQFSSALQELAQQVQEGRGDSLDTLKTKINVQGAEMTLGQLVDISAEMKRCLEVMPEFTGSSLSIEGYYASAGLVASHMRNYAATRYSDELGEQLKDVVISRMRTVEEAYESMWSRADFGDGTTYSYISDPFYEMWWNLADTLASVKSGNGYSADLKAKVDGIEGQLRSFLQEFGKFGTDESYVKMLTNHTVSFVMDTQRKLMGGFDIRV